jgi:cysteine desulfurase
MKRIYLDNAATTPTDPSVLDAMLPYFSNISGNPSSLHKEGRDAHAALENARRTVAEILAVNPNGIIFTGSGTESDNMAIFGVARAYKHKGDHIIVSSFEHKAVLESVRKLEKEGFAVTYVQPQKNGIIRATDIEKALTKRTILVSIMAAQNEIGTIQPISAIGKKIEQFRKKHSQPFPFFHTDACQAAGALDIRPASLFVDLLTINGSKIYGPKGIGCLYYKTGVMLEPLICGGGQEFSKRGGTESLPLIIGFAKALELAEKRRRKESARLIKLRDRLIREIRSAIPNTRFNGDLVKRLPNNINISFYGIEGESLLLLLDREGIAASTASACNAHDLSPSHVLKAIAVPDEWAHGTIRFTLGRRTRSSDITHVLRKLPQLVEQLRNISTLQ